MSKKELLNETQIRRFMTLANLEPLVKNVLKEGDGQMPVDAPDRRADERRKEDYARLKEAAEEGEDSAGDDAGGDSDVVDVDMGDAGGEEAAGGDDDKTAAFEAAVKALADSLGIEVEMGDGEGGGEEAAGGEEEAGGADAGGEEDAGGTMEEMYDQEEMDEGKKKEEEEEEEEMDEGVALSEDALVEAVLARVTARLVHEAKKKKMSAKEKMDKMKKEKEAAAKKKKALDEATDSKGGGPLLKQGKNKHDTYKGHADMAYAKGKEGKGGHQMEPLTAKAEHSVTHGGKNLATLGGNKKKV